MPDFADIASEYEKIKDTPEIMDAARVTENTVGGKSADAIDRRQKYLPDEATHAKNVDRLATMFDKTKRAGARSSLHGLILPNGRQNFSQFHDQYTGTGRIPKKDDRQGRFTPSDNAPQSESNTPKVSVVLYEKCIECMERVRQDDIVPDMDILPPTSRFEGEIDKWARLGLKPGMVICSLFCGQCVLNFRAEHQKILNDPFTNSIQLVMPDGTMGTLAAKNAEVHKLAHRKKTRENIMAMIEIERDNPQSQCFYGDAII